MTAFRQTILMVTVTASIASLAGCASLTQPQPGPSTLPAAPESSSASPKPPATIEDETLRDEAAVVRVTEGTCDGGATGSGFLVDARHVVTVAHVVAGSTSVVVRRADGRVARARVVGEDEDREVALLELDRDLKTQVTLKFASTAAKQLDPVGAIGYPLGGALTTTTGQVTALDTRVNLGQGQTIKGLTQFNAAISHGSSGGPVIDRTGRVVGLVEAEKAEGNSLYYAVPSTIAAPLVQGWEQSPDPVPDPDCPDSESPVTIESKHPDAPSVAISLENYFGGLAVGNEELTLTDGTELTGYELAARTLTEDLARKYPDADSLAAVYDGTRLSDVHLDKINNTGSLEDWADVSWSHTEDGICERHSARFTLRLDSGQWQLSHRQNHPNPSGDC